MTKIWRMYANGDVTDETRVLQPHYADGHRCTGYDGDVNAWSEHNKKNRPGCAQIHRDQDGEMHVLHQGYVSSELLDDFIQRQKQVRF